MQSSASTDLVNRYPMGPKVRAWLGVAEKEYCGRDNSEPSIEETEAFQTRLLGQMEDAMISNGETLADLLEELVGMNLPLLAIRLVDSYPDQFLHDDFRSQLHLGNACMLAGEFHRAEQCFRAAQGLVPAEPSPYVNLVQIYCQDQLFDTALTWCQAGLDADPNFLRLWELLAWIYQKLDFPSAKQKVAGEAKRRHSWAGATLSADLAVGPDSDPDPRAKVIALESFYNEGLRDPEFLVEYTAALGMAGQYERIPPVLWQVERQASSGLPWQLYFHVIQAFLGLSREDQASEMIERVSAMSNLPPQAREQLEALKAEAKGQQH